MSTAFPGPRRFAPRPVGLDQFVPLWHEALALVTASPLRLFGLFLVVFLPVQLLPNLPYVAMPLRATLASIGFTGFFAALDAVQRGETPTLQHMASAWRLAPDKIVLLVISACLPLACALGVWWFDMGPVRLAELLGSTTPAAAIDAREQFEFVVAINGLDMPLLFVQPLCILYTWSASRTLAADLLAWLANWRWALLITLVVVPVAVGLDAYDPGNALEVLLALGGEVVVEVILSAFTLVLLRRSLG